MHLNCQKLSKILTFRITQDVAVILMSQDAGYIRKTSWRLQDIIVSLDRRIFQKHVCSTSKFSKRRYRRPGATGFAKYSRKSFTSHDFGNFESKFRKFRTLQDIIVILATQDCTTQSAGQSTGRIVKWWIVVGLNGNGSRGERWKLIFLTINVNLFCEEVT